MLQFGLKIFIKVYLTPYFTVDKVKQPAHQNIGDSHQINNAIIDALRLTIIGFTLQSCPTHSALGLH